MLPKISKIKIRKISAIKFVEFFTECECFFSYLIIALVYILLFTFVGIRLSFDVPKFCNIV